MEVKIMNNKRTNEIIMVISNSVESFYIPLTFDKFANAIQLLKLQKNGESDVEVWEKKRD